MIKFLKSLPSRIRGNRDERSKVEQFSDNLVFLQSMPSADISEAISCGKIFLSLTQNLRLHNKILMNESILDKYNTTFNELDPRSLSYMLEICFGGDQGLIQEMEREIEIRAMKNKKK